MTTVLTAPGGKSTFPRGIHPIEGKQLAEDAAIEVMPAPAEARLALLQHLGAPCECSLKPKTEVAMGDVVGQARAFVSAPVHASVTGTIAKVGMATLPNGRHVQVVPIKVAEEQPLAGRKLFDDVFGGDWPVDGTGSYDPQQIVDAARDGGLVGLGGAAFPTHVKLARNADKPIQTLLVNGCECEPYLTADYRVMVEAPSPVVTGALLAGRAVGASRVIVAVEDNKAEAIAVLRKAAEGTPAEVRVVKTKYPQGGEKQLVYALLRKKVPNGGLPLDVGVVVLNVGTAAALARAVVRGKPLTHRVITVTGAGIRHPKNILAPVGVSYRELINMCGGLTDDAARVVAGGPMMGFTLGGPDTPATKGTSGVTVLTHCDIGQAAETACVRCGRCVDVCPMNLVPTKIALAARMGAVDIVERYHAPACMECGCCAYGCPASIPLVQLIRLGKVMMRERG